MAFGIVKGVDSMKETMDRRRLLSTLRIEHLERRPLFFGGCGALNSYAALGAARWGPPYIHLVDNQKVAPENIGPSAYTPDQIGMWKVDALAQLIRKVHPQTKVFKHRMRIEKRFPFSGFVFFGPDSMRSRMSMWESCVDNKRVSLVIDGRMGELGGKVIAANPNRAQHKKGYMREWHPDPIDASNPCIEDGSVGATVESVASHMLMRLIRWIHFEQGRTKKFENFFAWYFEPEFAIDYETW